MFHHNPRQRKSYAEEEFKRVYGAYPSDNELKQFLPYFRAKRLDKTWEISLKKI